MWIWNMRYEIWEVQEDFNTPIRWGRRIIYYMEKYMKMENIEIYTNNAPKIYRGEERKCAVLRVCVRKSPWLVWCSRGPGECSTRSLAQGGVASSQLKSIKKQTIYQEYSYNIYIYIYICMTVSLWFIYRTIPGRQMYSFPICFNVNL